MLCVVQLVLVAGIGLLVSAAHVYVRDVAAIVGVALLLLFYVTPVFYPLDAVPAQSQWIFDLNPAAVLVDLYRSVLLDGEMPPAGRLAALSLASVGVLALGWLVFRRLQAGFADELDPTAMRFEHVSKRYWRQGAGHRSLRGLVFGTGARGRREEFWAARDVSFEVPAGSATALIGGNGAGKSTLLRLAAGLSVPTEGTLAVPPQTVSVLGLGASFDGTLTGAENAFTALVVNGLRRRAAAAELAGRAGVRRARGLLREPGPHLQRRHGLAPRLRRRDAPAVGCAPRR